MNQRLVRAIPTHRRLWSALAVILLSLTSTLSAAAQESTPEQAAGPTGPSSTEPSSDELATARMHFANGVELLQTTPPNYQDAFRQFQLAYQKTHGSWKVMGNLGLCALKLERDGEALGYYEGYLKQGGQEIDAGERQHIEREMLLIKGNLAEVKLTFPPGDARLNVSRQGSSAPPQVYEHAGGESALGLRAGTLSITATDSSGKSLTWEVTVAAGESATHFFDFNAPESAPEGAVQAAATENSAAEQPSGTSSLRVAGWVTAGVGVAALGGGVVLGLMSQSKEKDAQKDCIGSVCKEDSESQFDSAKTMATVANVLFISGGVLAATGITLIIVGGKKSSSGASAQLGSRKATGFSLELAPLAQAGGGGVLAFGSF